MNFLSIDVETGGLAMDHSLLEIGLVWAHLNQPAEDWSDCAHCARVVLMHDTLAITPYCANMHYNLIREMHLVGESDWWEQTANDGYAYAKVATDQPESLSSYTTYYVLADLAAQGFKQALDDLGVPWQTEPITVAGKNPASFDVPFLGANKCLDPDEMPLPGMDGPQRPAVIFRRRMLDPGSLYYQAGDTELPSLVKCLHRAGLREMVLHTGVDDAVQVVKLLRHRLCDAAGPGFTPDFPPPTT